MMATTSATPSRFRHLGLTECIHALPQELIDQVQEEVFTCISKVQRVVRHPDEQKRGLRHLCKLEAPDTPGLLLVSKDTRAKFIESYYKDATITLPHSPLVLLSWQGRVSDEEQNTIKEVIVVSSRSFLDGQYVVAVQALKRFFSGRSANVRLVHDPEMCRTLSGY